jgi:hypothetical protein
MPSSSSPLSKARFTSLVEDVNVRQFVVGSRGKVSVEILRASWDDHGGHNLKSKRQYGRIYTVRHRRSELWKPGAD